MADLARPADGGEQHGRRREALDEVPAQLGAPAGVGDVQRDAGADDPRGPGRAAVEGLDVALVLAALVAHHVGVAGRGALGDLEDQDLVDRERVVERVR